MIYKDELKGSNVTLRAVDIGDCNDTYLSWMNNPYVNRFLETRWERHTLEDIKSFVNTIRESDHSYLFAIIVNDGSYDGTKHIGNIKIGPINKRYSYADISYFIGEMNYWGKGLATEAISLVTRFGFEYLNLHRIQAGAFGKNIGSAKALMKAGFKQEGCLKEQLYTPDVVDDHLYFGILKKELFEL